ncbi:MAG: esterase [Anaerolineae bacterium]|nr:esterase [Anaerolineae bacterium]
MNHGEIQTVTGPVAVEALGLILPHEHLFTDLRGPLAPGYAQADPERVAQVMAPHLKAAHAAGVTALVECSTVGVGRNVAVLRRLAQASPLYLIAPTGVYREAFIPPALREMDAQALAERWMGELMEGIEGSDVRAGFIKLAVSDDGPTPLEVRNLRAAAQASLQTGAVIASHTASGALARHQMDLLEAEGLDLRRFIWVHANLEPDTACHLEAARRGAYVEFDAVGAAWQPQATLVEYTLALIEAGYAEHILLSHDAGWYNPASPDGQPEGGIRGYTALVEDFLPALRARGVTDELLHLITVVNPAHAFALAVG